MLGMAPVASSRKRLGFSLLSGMWVTLSGVVGLVVAGLWGLTGQYLAYNNANIWQLHPGIWAIWLAICAGTLGVRAGKVAARWIALGVATVSVVGVLVQLTPGVHQANGLILVFVVPAHIGLAWGLWHWQDPDGVSADGAASVDRTAAVPTSRTT